MKNIMILLTVSLILLATTSAHPLITAISYDPPGSDGGYEWVELFNPTNESLSLRNYSLQKGNGANEDDWKLVWSNSSFVMLPLTFYVIGEQQVTQSDELVALGLQNGPDGIRLLSENNTIETIGWGEHEYAEYYSGDSVDDIASSVLVRNYSIVENRIIFTQTSNNKKDFYFKSERTPRNQFFSVSQLLLPDDTTTDVTYVITIPNQRPIMHGAQLLLDDVSEQNRHQVVVPEDSLLPIRIFVDDGNGISDITSIEYELQLAGEAFLSDEVMAFTNVTNKSMEVEIPFFSSYPPGLYTIVLAAKDSQNELSQSAGLQFETQFVLGVAVLDDVLVFETNEDAHNFTTSVTLQNTGNVDSKLDFVLQSEFDVGVTYVVDTKPLLTNSLSLLRPGENVTLEIIVTPQNTMRAGRYTGLFRVVTHEAIV